MLSLNNFNSQTAGSKLLHHLLISFCIMKKITFFFILSLACAHFSFAQISQDQLRQDLEMMEKQMAEAFKIMEGTLQDGRLLEGLDTMMFKMIPMNPNQIEPEVYPKGDPYQLHHFLDQFMGTFSEENIKELEQFFQEFEQRLPKPEEFQDSTEPGEKQGDTSNKSRKKKKIHKL